MGILILLLLSVGAILGITIYRLALSNQQLKEEREALRHQVEQLKRESKDAIVYEDMPE
jgi:hypothetical protein